MRAAHQIEDGKRCGVDFIILPKWALEEFVASGYIKETDGKVIHGGMEWVYAATLEEQAAEQHPLGPTRGQVKDWMMRSWPLS